MDAVRRIKNQQSPKKSLRERPKSECLNFRIAKTGLIEGGPGVRWAKTASVDGGAAPSVNVKDEGYHHSPSVTVKDTGYQYSPRHRIKRAYKERPKSDLGKWFLF